MTPAAAADAGRLHDAELARYLVALEGCAGRAQRLAAVLARPAVRRAIAGLIDEPAAEGWRASPLGQESMAPLWSDAAALASEISRLDPARLAAAALAWTGSESAARVLTEMLCAAHSATARAVRAAAYLTLRAEAGRDLGAEAIDAAAHGVPAFADDLAAVVTAVRRFMRELRLRSRAPLFLRPYGFGEMSRPVGLDRAAFPFAPVPQPRAIVYKRLAPFPAAADAELYLAAYDEYHRRLRHDVGIAVPPWGHGTLAGPGGRRVVICTQAALDPRSIGKAVLLARDASQGRVLFQLVAAEYRKVIRHNQAAAPSGFAIGIDGQITNWAVDPYDHDAPLSGRERLLYIDTNTPMMRRHGKDCLPLDFYLRAVPGPLRPLMRPLAKHILDRYFDARTILVDFLANTSIHGRDDLLAAFVADANAFLAEGLIVPEPAPIAIEEVRRYIRRDTATWRLSRGLRVVGDYFAGRRGALATARILRRIYTDPIF